MAQRNGSAARQRTYQRGSRITKPMLRVRSPSLAVGETATEPTEEWRTTRGVRICVPADTVSSSARPKVVEMAEFLAEDLRHLFDEQGIDRSRYASSVDFEDPISSYSTIGGYMANINMLRRLFKPDFRLFSVVATGENELTTRWRMLMDHLSSVPFTGKDWRPRLAFSGVSIMRFDSDRMQFTSHIDKHALPHTSALNVSPPPLFTALSVLVRRWDSLSNNQHFSFEGLYDLITQVVSPLLTPELPSPEYDVLRRTRDYEIRDYQPFSVAETSMRSGNEGKAFQQLAGFIYGSNSKNETLGMTTPVLTNESKMQFALPPKIDSSDAPSPKGDDDIIVRRNDGGIYAARAFNGTSGENDRMQQSRALHDALKRDGLAQYVHEDVASTLLARYNEPGVPGILRRNEVLLPMEGYRPENEDNNE